MSSLLRTLLSDEETDKLLGDDALIGAMVRVEIALAKVQAELGLIPTRSGAEIASSLANFSADLQALRAGMRKDGVPVPALVKQLREHVGGEAAGFLHWGATTQDIVDTALLLQLRPTIDLLEQRCRKLIAELIRLAEQNQETPLVARTRFQQALPTLFDFKIAGWIAPLLRHLERLVQLKPRLFMVQLGGREWR